MVKKIVVDPAILVDTAGRIEESAADYEQLYTKLYSETDSMAANWQGADNIAFTDRIEGFREDLDKMAQLMNSYAEFLRNAAAQYEAAQEEVKNAAGKLAN